MKNKNKLWAVIALGVLGAATGIAGCYKSQTVPANTGNLLKEGGTTGTTEAFELVSTYGLETGEADTAKPIPWTHIDTGAQKTLYMPPGTRHIDTGANKSKFNIPWTHADTGANKTIRTYPPGYTHIDTGANKTVVTPPGGFTRHIDTGANKTLMVPKDYTHIDTGANKTYYIKNPVVTTPDTVKPVTPVTPGTFTPVTPGEGTAEN